MKLYNRPIRVPNSNLSEIWNTQGLIREINAPEKSPYSTDKIMMIEALPSEGVHNKKQKRPENRADGINRLKRPQRSDKYPGRIRPMTLPPFIAESV